MKTNLSYKKKSMKKHIDVNKNINMIKNNKTKKYKGGFSQPKINHYHDEVQGNSDELKEAINKMYRAFDEFLIEVGKTSIPLLR